MHLTLEVIGEKAARMGRVVRQTFTSGGTIGRLADNDWVLPDEYISGHHARILFSNGAFLIEDTSTNGVFLNSQRNRLRKGKPHPLRSGDTIFIGDYEVRVTLVQEQSVAESFASARPCYSGESLIPDDLSFEGAPGSAGAPSAMDPLALLGLQSERAVSPGPSAASLQNQSPLSEHYRPPTPLTPTPSSPTPSAKPPAAPGFIPDDYDPMGSDALGADEDPFAGGPLPSIPLQEQEPPAPAPVRAAPPSARPANSQRAAPVPTIMTGPPRMPKPGPRADTAESRPPPLPARIDRGPSHSAHSPGFDPFEAPSPDFDVFATVRIKRDGGHMMPASRAWLLAGTIFSLVSAHLWMSA